MMPAPKVPTSSSTATGSRTPAPRPPRSAKRLGFDIDYRYSGGARGIRGASSAPTNSRPCGRDSDVAFVAEDAVAEAAGVVPLAPGEPRPPTGVRRIRAATADQGPGGEHLQRRRARHRDQGSAIRTSTPSAAPTAIDLGTPPQDGNGHGTHMAGTIGALNNGTGVVGVAPGTKVFAVRVLGDAGVGSVVDIICGIDWVTANHAAAQHRRRQHEPDRDRVDRPDAALRDHDLAAAQGDLQLDRRGGQLRSRRRQRQPVLRQRPRPTHTRPPPIPRCSR